jgi:Ohr subfamily peroxiredoxin
MFAAGYAACFHSSLRYIASTKGLDVSESAVSVSIALTGSTRERQLDLAAEIEVQLPGLDEAAAAELVQEAHQLCPYSRATNGNMPVMIRIAQDD